MKNLKYIMATLMVALIVAVVFVACSKDKETPVQEANNNSDNEPNTEVVERKPIATMDTKTGKMTYNVSVDELQRAMDESIVLKGEEERYIFESFEIVQSNSKDENKSGIKFSVIDTEEETSSTNLLYDGFLKKETTNDTLFYYLDDDFVNGNYTFVTFTKNGAIKIFVENGNAISYEEVSQDSLLVGQMGGGGKWHVECKGHNCSGGCLPYDTDVQLGCSPCPVQDDTHWCEQKIWQDGGGINWEEIAAWVTIFSTLGKFLLHH